MTGATVSTMVVCHAPTVRLPATSIARGRKLTGTLSLIGSGHVKLQTWLPCVGLYGPLALTQGAVSPPVCTSTRETRPPAGTGSDVVPLICVYPFSVRLMIAGSIMLTFGPTSSTAKV